MYTVDIAVEQVPTQNGHCYKMDTSMKADTFTKQAIIFQNKSFITVGKQPL